MCLHISWEPEKCSASKVVWSTSAQVTWKSQCSLGCLEHIVQSEQELKEIPPCRVGTNACQADPCKILGNSWLVKKEELSKCPSVRTGMFSPIFGKYSSTIDLQWLSFPSRYVSTHACGYKQLTYIFWMAPIQDTSKTVLYIWGPWVPQGYNLRTKWCPGFLPSGLRLAYSIFLERNVVVRWHGVWGTNFLGTSAMFGMNQNPLSTTTEKTWTEDMKETRLCP